MKTGFFYHHGGEGEQQQKKLTLLINRFKMSIHKILKGKFQ